MSTMAMYFWVIGASLITSIISLIGLFSLFISGRYWRSVMIILVSFSAGTLLGDSFLHLLPEAVESKSDYAWPAVLIGILVFFILEKIIHWRHCHLEPNKDHKHPVGLMNLIGDGLHNFIDGILIAGSFMVDWRLGVVTTIAIIAHEIPQELGDFATLIYAGYQKNKALIFNFFSGLLSLIGAILTLMIGQVVSELGSWIVPFSAGGFIYIATADLIPELKKETNIKYSLIQFLAIAIGLIIMYLFRYLE